MSLHKIQDFDPDYHDRFEGKDVIGYPVYARDEKVGSVEDILIEDNGEFRYLVIHTGLWVFGKKILLPIGCTRINYERKEVHADTLDEEQVKALPEYNEGMTVDFDHEETVRNVYRSRGSSSAVGVPAGMGVGYGGADTAPTTNNTPPRVDTSVGYDGYDRDTYCYDRDPDLYTLDDHYHSGFKKYKTRYQESRATGSSVC
ncbi:PRC-barrel domain-containing protein [Pannus brasiliensis CCIBt3594]|uniref:PRC-barrel domain-containing protein n=1 Tax=Pannus brasiliensis CCIBt3594 TaxID=1427578 RepID=A0AAW9QV65_9CHRO